MSTNLNDYRWLISREAQCHLEFAQREMSTGENVLRIVKKLRKILSVEQAALVLELAQLRIKARIKFVAADKMFFTRSALEMATDDRIAAHKSGRFADRKRIADICCSIGGDLLGLARTGTAKGFDSDPLAMLYAEANLKAVGLTSTKVHQSFFADVEPTEFDGIHIDPQRRHQTRSTRGENFSPALKEIFERTRNHSAVAIKVAPASKPMSYYPPTVERQWIGHSRECKQQIVWTGELATNAACRTATRLGKSGSVTEFSMNEKQANDCRPDWAEQIGAFVYEPHNVVLAAKLADPLAREFELKKLGPDIVYWTSEHCVSNKLLTRFQVLEVLPANLTQVANVVQNLDIGTLHIKKRGVPEFFADKFKRIKLKGSEVAALLVTRFKDQRIAIIARRESNV